jgi:O-antigen ligase
MSRRPIAAVVRRKSPGSWWGELIGGVQFTPSFSAFLYYVFVVVTYWLPGADVAIALALFSMLLRPQDWRIAPSMVWVGAFVIWAILAWVSSPYRADSWEQTFSLIKVWIVTVVAYNVVRTKAQLRFFLIFAVGCFALFPMRGAFVNYLGGYSVWGRALWNFAYANPNDLAAFTLLYIAFSFAVFFLCRTSLIRLGALVCGGLMMLLILFTQSRGALLALIAAVGLAMLAKWRNPRVLLAAAALSLAAATLAPKTAWERLGGLLGASASDGFKGADREGSAEQRYQLLKVSAIVANDNPLFGVGPGAYSIAHGSYARQHVGEFPLALGNRDPHNTMMRLAAEMGYTGAAIFVMMIVSALFRARRTRLATRDARLGDVLRFLSIGLVAFMLAGLFGSIGYLNLLYLTLAMMECTIALARHGAEGHMIARNLQQRAEQRRYSLLRARTSTS